MDGRIHMPIKSSLFKICWTTILCLLFVLQISALAQDWGKITPYEWTLEPPADYPNANAVVIFDNCEAEISAYDGVSLERHVRIKVFDKDQADNAMTVEIESYEDDKISGVKAHTLTPDDKKIKVKDKFKKKAGGKEILTFTFPAVQNGSIIEYKYKQHHERLWLLDPWFFQSDIYTLKSSYSMVLHQGFKYSIACSNMPYDLKTPVEEVERLFGVEYTRFTWQMKNMLPVQEEPKSSAILNSQSALYLQLVSYQDPYNSVSLITEWSDLGKIMQDLYDDFAGDIEDLEEMAAAITADAQNHEEALAALYRFVRDSIITAEDQSGYFIESNVQDILKEKKAPSSDKNMLLCAFLQNRGFDAHPLMIGTRDHIRFNPELKQLIQFNHLLCHVKTEAQEYVLDASCRSTVFPHLPCLDLIYSGLLIDGKSSRIIKLNPLKRESGKKIFTRLYLETDGSATCSTCICIRGHNIYDYDDYLCDSVSEIHIADDFLNNLQIEYELLGKSVYYGREGDSLSVRLSLELPSLGNFLGDNLLVPLNLINPESNPFESKRRLLPVDFIYTYDARAELEIIIPEGMKVSELPAHMDKSVNGLSFIRAAMADTSRILIISKLSINKPYFETSEYADVKAVFDAMEEAALDQIALVRKE
jgi:hypothetical protein